ncbi:hypothetical protein ABEY43_07015 [Priestia megaterium]
MANLRKYGRELIYKMVVDDPERKKDVESDIYFIEKKAFYLSEGYDEDKAYRKAIEAWFFKLAEDYECEMSIVDVSKEKEMNLQHPNEWRKKNGIDRAYGVGLVELHEQDK